VRYEKKIFFPINIHVLLRSWARSSAKKVLKSFTFSKVTLKNFYMGSFLPSLGSIFLLLPTLILFHQILNTTQYVLKGACLDFTFFIYVIQHCFICRPSESTGSEDAGSEPRTVAKFALTARRSTTRIDLIHYSARSHPLFGYRSHPHFIISTPSFIHFFLLTSFHTSFSALFYYIFSSLSAVSFDGYSFFDRR
jgi:hypothetical protein